MKKQNKQKKESIHDLIFAQRYINEAGGEDYSNKVSQMVNILNLGDRNNPTQPTKQSRTFLPDQTIMDTTFDAK